MLAYGSNGGYVRAPHELLSTLQEGEQLASQSRVDKNSAESRIYPPAELADSLMVDISVLPHELIHPTRWNIE